MRCLRATDLTPQDFQAYLKSRAAEVDAGTVWITWKALAACWNWGAGTKRGGGGHLPKDHRPFKEFECPPEPIKELLWGDLPTDKELTALLSRAKREGLHEILVVLAETGCRPGELAKARVKHFDESQIILHKHKTSKRQTDSKPRRICLQGRSLSVVKQLVDSRVSADAHVFVRFNGSPWNISRLGHTFARLRGGVVREHLTLYSLRHWFISRAVRDGYPLLTIARAVGTSIKMIDKHYGHFAPSDIADMHASLARKLKTA